MKYYKLSNMGESTISTTLKLTLAEVKMLRRVIKQLNDGKTDGNWFPVLYLGKGYTIKK